MVGGAPFDRDNDREFLCYVPFADHNAMIDPSTPDLTARVLEALGISASEWETGPLMGQLLTCDGRRSRMEAGSAVGV